MDMPELEIDTEEARELEVNALAVLSDKGITLRTEGANVFNLILSVLTIYGPIFIALWFRMTDKKEPAQIMPPAPRQHAAHATPAPATAHYTPPPQTMPQPAPEPAVPAMPTFVPSTSPTGDVRTVNGVPGMPETEGQMLPGGGSVFGAFFRTDNNTLGPIS